MPSSSDPRWVIQIRYRGDKKELAEHFFVSELSELQAIVERGPHWDTIIKIAICRTRGPGLPAPALTVEQAEKL